MTHPNCCGITQDGERLFREVFGDDAAERTIDDIDPRPPRPMLFDYATQTPYPGTLQDLAAEHTHLTAILRQSDVRDM